MPNEVKFLNVEPGGHLHRRSSMVHGGSFLLDSASYGAAVVAPVMARKRSARFASMFARCEKIVQDVIEEIEAADPYCILHDGLFRVLYLPAGLQASISPYSLKLSTSPSSSISLLSWFEAVDLR